MKGSDKEAYCKISNEYDKDVHSNAEESSCDENEDCHEPASDDDEACPICLNEFDEQQIGIPNNCQHAFCVDCILEWSKNVNTCPIDRIKYESILVFHCFAGTFLREVAVQGRNCNFDDEDGITYCEICGRGDNEETLLLCDGCDLGYHCACLQPSLMSIPAGEWFCDSCQRSRNIMSGRSQSRLVGRTNLSERVRRHVTRTRLRLAEAHSSFEEQLDAIVDEILRNAGQRLRIKPPSERRNRRLVKRSSSKRSKSRNGKRKKRKSRSKPKRCALPKVISYSRDAARDGDVLTSFSLTGNADELDEYSAREIEDESEPSYLIAQKHRLLTQSAIRFNAPLPSLLTCGNPSSREHNLAPPLPAVPDILSSILENQNLLHTSSDKVTIQRGGKLVFKDTTMSTCLSGVHQMSKNSILHQLPKVEIPKSPHISKTVTTERRTMHVDSKQTAYSNKDKRAGHPLPGKSSFQKRNGELTSEPFDALGEQKGGSATSKDRSSSSVAGRSKQRILIRPVLNLPKAPENTSETKETYDPSEPTEDDNIHKQEEAYDPFQPTLSDEENESRNKSEQEKSPFKKLTPKDSQPKTDSAPLTDDMDIDQLLDDAAAAVVKKKRRFPILMKQQSKSTGDAGEKDIDMFAEEELERAQAAAQSASTFTKGRMRSLSSFSELDEKEGGMRSLSSFSERDEKEGSLPEEDTDNPPITSIKFKKLSNKIKAAFTSQNQDHTKSGTNDAALENTVQSNTETLEDKTSTEIGCQRDLHGVQSKLATPSLPPSDKNVSADETKHVKEVADASTDKRKTMKKSDHSKDSFHQNRSRSKSPKKIKTSSSRSSKTSSRKREKDREKSRSRSRSHSVTRKRRRSRSREKHSDFSVRKARKTDLTEEKRPRAKRSKSPSKHHGSRSRKSRSRSRDQSSSKKQSHKKDRKRSRSRSRKRSGSRSKKHTEDRLNISNKSKDDETRGNRQDQNDQDHTKQDRNVQDHMKQDKKDQDHMKQDKKDQDHMKQDNKDQDHMKQDNKHQDHMKQDNKDQAHMKQDNKDQVHMKQDNKGQAHMKQDEKDQDHMKQVQKDQDHLKHPPYHKEDNLKQESAFERENLVTLPGRTEEQLRHDTALTEPRRESRLTSVDAERSDEKLKSHKKKKKHKHEKDYFHKSPSSSPRSSWKKKKKHKKHAQKSSDDEAFYENSQSHKKHKKRSKENDDSDSDIKSKKKKKKHLVSESMELDEVFHSDPENKTVLSKKKKHSDAEKKGINLTTAGDLSETDHKKKKKKKESKKDARDSDSEVKYSKKKKHKKEKHQSSEMNVVSDEDDTSVLVTKIDSAYSPSSEKNASCREDIYETKKEEMPVSTEVTSEFEDQRKLTAENASTTKSFDVAVHSRRPMSPSASKVETVIDAIKQQLVSSYKSAKENFTTFQDVKPEKSFHHNQPSTKADLNSNVDIKMSSTIEEIDQQPPVHCFLNNSDKNESYSQDFDVDDLLEEPYKQAEEKVRDAEGVTRLQEPLEAIAGDTKVSETFHPYSYNKNFCNSTNVQSTPIITSDQDNEEISVYAEKCLEESRQRSVTSFRNKSPQNLLFEPTVSRTTEVTKTDADPYLCEENIADESSTGSHSASDIFRNLSAAEDNHSTGADETTYEANAKQNSSFEADLELNVVDGAVALKSPSATVMQETNFPLSQDSLNSDSKSPEIADFEKEPVLSAKNNVALISDPEPVEKPLDIVFQSAEKLLSASLPLAACTLTEESSLIKKSPSNNRSTSREKQQKQEELSPESPETRLPQSTEKRKQRSRSKSLRRRSSSKSRRRRSRSRSRRRRSSSRSRRKRSKSRSRRKRSRSRSRRNRSRSRQRRKRSRSRLQDKSSRSESRRRRSKSKSTSKRSRSRSRRRRSTSRSPYQKSKSKSRGKGSRNHDAVKFSKASEVRQTFSRKHSSHSSDKDRNSKKQIDSSDSFDKDSKKQMDSPRASDKDRDSRKRIDSPRGSDKDRDDIQQIDFFHSSDKDKDSKQHIDNSPNENFLSQFMDQTPHFIPLPAPELYEPVISRAKDVVSPQAISTISGISNLASVPHPEHSNPVVHDDFSHPPEFDANTFRNLVTRPTLIEIPTVDNHVTDTMRNKEPSDDGEAANTTESMELYSPSYPMSPNTPDESPPPPPPPPKEISRNENQATSAVSLLSSMFDNKKDANTSEESTRIVQKEESREKDPDNVLNPTQILNIVGLNPQQQSAAKDAIMSIAELSKQLQLGQILNAGDQSKKEDFGQKESDGLSPVNIDNIESSAVALYNYDKRKSQQKKKDFQQQVVAIAKAAIKPHYEAREVNKEQYKDIMKKAVNKICQTDKTMEANEVKVRRLIRRYVDCYKLKNERNKEKMQLALDQKSSKHLKMGEKETSPGLLESPPSPEASPFDGDPDLTKEGELENTPTLLKKEPRKIITLPDLPLPPPPPPPRPKYNM